jgi:glycosyltransferase involved in cell wall biosynthesis
MKLVKNKAVFIPLAHDEPIFYKTPSTLFSTPALTMFNTTTEMELVKKRIAISEAKSVIVGCGVNEEVVFDSSFIYPNPYLIFLGRIEKMKGAGLLMDYFMKFSQKHNHYGLKLLLLGNKKMEIPKHDDIVYLGFRSESEKFQYLNNALALVNPSFLESLSLIVLESFYVETPVIVNGACDVLVDHVNKSDAGFIFNSFEEFETAVIQLLESKEIRKKMSEKGKIYYNKNYRWSVIEEKTVSSIHALITKGET